MGQYLSIPATEKHYESGSNDRLFYGLAEMQGWRLTMEDAHTAVLDLDGPGTSGNAFFAIYDGHGGSSVAKYAGENVHKILVAEESYKERNWETSLKKAFLGTDVGILESSPTDQSGCTAVAALVTNDNKLYVANAGDSRSVLSVKGTVKPLSFDHKPTNVLEIARIKEAGGFLENGRVNGTFAMSRSLGDFLLKKNPDLSPEAQIITANPDVTCHEISEEDEFLILACDGIWDCLSSQQVVDLVRYQVSTGKELTEVCEMIIEHCLAPDTKSQGCDNMTLLIVGITHGRTKKQWYQWVKDRVKNGYGNATPSTPPMIYPRYKLETFRAQREAWEAQDKLLAKNKQAPTKPKGVVSVKEPAQLSLVAAVVAYLSNLVGAVLSAITGKWKR